MRTTNGPARNRARSRLFRRARGFHGGRGNLYRPVVETLLRAGAYAYRDRRLRKRDFHKLWIIRINAAVRQQGLRYSEFIHGLHKAHTRQIKVKEIRVRPKTGDHDIVVKVGKARDFLSHKDKVLLSVMFRGRELAHVEEGRRVIDEILQQLEDCSKVEAPPSQQGRRIVCTLAPK